MIGLMIRLEKVASSKERFILAKEAQFLALCLDYQKNISTDCYLFTDNKKIKYELNNFKNVDLSVTIEL